MKNGSDRVIVIGAGPVGLCLSLALAQQGVPVCVIEQLRDDNFLDQVPRAGTNHPATLEMYEDIGLYRRLEPRGIIAPLFHYWDRAKGELIAEFDHAVLKDDTRFPFALQCERIKIVEEALDIEFEGFTYADRTLNIEVAYDFRRHGYTDRNYISDPEEWSNLFHWKGPPERWRVHFPTKPEEDPDALTDKHAMQDRLQ